MKKATSRELHPKSWTLIRPLGCFSWRSTTSGSNVSVMLHPLNEALRKSQPGKLRSIPVRLLFNDPGLNLRAEFSCFDRETGRPVCVGNGETCCRTGDAGMEELPCPSPDGCAFGQAPKSLLDCACQNFWFDRDSLGAGPSRANTCPVFRWLPCGGTLLKVTRRVLKNGGVPEMSQMPAEQMTNGLGKLLNH